MASDAQYCALVLLVMAFTVWVISMHGIITNKDVREYQATFSFQETKCSVQGVVDHGRTPCEYKNVYYQGYTKMRVKYGPLSSARPAYPSHHRCIEVVVRYHDVKGITRNGTLYQNTTLLSDMGQHCSFADCGPDEDTTNEQVQASLYELSKASSIKCHYNPKDHGQVILNKITLSQVVSSVWLIGYISLMGCVVVLLGLIGILAVLVKVLVEMCTCNVDNTFQGKLKVLIQDQYVTLTEDDLA